MTKPEAKPRFNPDGVFWGAVLVVLVSSSVGLFALAIALEIRAK